MFGINILKKTANIPIVLHYSMDTSVAFIS